jgi:hypothetical protein
MAIFWLGKPRKKPNPEIRSWLAGGCNAPSQKGAGDAFVAGWRGVFSGV